MGWLPEPSETSTALVTGASAGIGAEIARELASRGHGVTLVARRRDRLEELARELSSAHGVRAEALDADLVDPEARAALPGRLADLGLDVEVLVNNAGFGTAGPFHESDVDRELQLIRILIEAVADLSHRFVRPMVERGRGAVLNVASTAGFTPLPNMAGYGAAKAWSRSFSAALHEELRPRGVAVTALCPGPVNTEFFDVAGPTPIEKLIPRALWVDPDHVARTAVDALARNRAEVVPGRPMSALVTGARFIPQELRNPVAGRVFK
jgi:short-subunit dehydrogenase